MAEGATGADDILHRHRRDVARDRRAASTTHPSASGDGRDTDSSLRVVLIQDGPSAARVRAALARDRGVALRCARSVGAALALLEAAPADAVILDGGDAAALDLVRLLRVVAPTAAVLLLTDGRDRGFAQLALQAGAEEVLPALPGGAALQRALHDAVERHRRNAAVRVEAEQHAAIVEGSIQGIVIHQDGVIHYANAAIARILGCESSADLLGCQVLDFIAPHERERVLALARAQLGSGESEPQLPQYELDAERRDGTRVRLECLVTPIRWQGRAAVASTMIDITERKRAEDAMRTLAEVGRELVGTVALADAAKIIVSRVRDLFGARLGLLYRVAHGGSGLVCVAAYGGRAPEAWVGRSIPAGQGMSGRSVAEGHPVWSRNILCDPRVHLADPLRALLREEEVNAGIAVPLVLSGQPVGAIVLGDPLEHAFRHDNVELLRSFADRAALAVERAALYERSAARAEKLAVLARVSSLIASAAGSERVLDAVARAAVSLLGATSAGVLVYDPASRSLRIGEHYLRDSSEPWVPADLTHIAYGQGIAGRVVELREPMFVEDIAEDARWLDRSAVLGDFHAYAGLPLVARDRVIGVLSILFGERRTFSAEESELMALLADQAAIAMDNARLLEETERRRSTAEALAEVGRLLAQSLDVAEVGDRVTETVQALVGVSHAALFRVRPASQDLASLSARGDHGVGPGDTIVYPLGQGAVGLAASERRPVVTADVLADLAIPQPAAHVVRLQRVGFRAVLAVPLLVQGRVVGALALGDRPGRQFTDEEVQVAEAFGSRAAVALETARLYEEIRDARDFLQSIADSSPDAIVTTDVRGHISYWSRGAQELFGYTAAEVLGRTVGSFYAGGLEEARAVMARLRLLDRLRDYETDILVKNGRALAVSVSLSLLRRGDGALAGTVGVVKDVTERKVLEESFRQAQKMEAVGRLAGGIAHDFNNLITVVVTRSQLLLERLRPEDPLRQDVELFLRTAERAATLTRQLLAFSRRQVLQPKVLDLNVVVANMESLLRRLIGEDVELRTALTSPPWPVRADPGQLEQVVVNLVVNARDAMPHGGRLTVETANVELGPAYGRVHDGVLPGPHVMLAVSDTGVGMDAETRARIFEPFFTTKEPGKGTGLGLSTVYGIVKQSGGHVWVYSEPGYGTTFKIYLPRAIEIEHPVGAEAVPARADGGAETILLVEDEPDLRSVLRETLELFGYTILEAQDGKDAFQVAGAHAGPIDLVLTDVVMPAMNGAELARRLGPLRPETRILFMSGYTDEAIVHHGVIEPGIAFLGKPFSGSQLARRVREVLDATRH